MKNSIYTKLIGISLSFLLLVSCEDWLEIEEPNTMIVSSEVFENDESAQSAMQGIYNQLYQASFSAGWLGSVSVLSELSSDNLEPIRSNSFVLMQYHQHDLQANNSYNQNLWDGAYNIIYMANALLEGLGNSHISPEVAKRLEGEGRFVRAFTYFYLVNLYGDVPLVLTTDYRRNAAAKRTPAAEIYQHILDDLEISIEFLEADYIMGERTYVNRYAAMALLARVHLYLGNWSLAETYSSEVIAQSSLYDLINDYDQIFLANSQEAIWQLSPLGSGTILTNTNEGSVFIINPIIPSLSYVKLSMDFVDGLEPGDRRRMHWVKYHEGIEAYYAFKYKVQNSTDALTEYSMVLRLAEQYLIRAEARAQQNNLSGAIADLDKIRERAGLDLLSVTNPGISQEALLNEILKERRHELFTEWGHRWLDLKRTGKAEDVLAPNNPNWNSTDKLYPIPEEELMRNPNLIQNPGY